MSENSEKCPSQIPQARGNSYKCLNWSTTEKLQMLKQKMLGRENVFYLEKQSSIVVQ